MTYCTNQQVKNYCPPQIRTANGLDDEITIWKPTAEENINALFQERYDIPLVFTTSTLVTPSSHLAIEQACALFTVYYLLTNSYAQYNFALPKEKQEDKTQQISNIKYSQALHLLKRWISKDTDWIDPDLAVKDSSESVASLSECVQVFTTERTMVDNFVNRAYAGYGRGY